MDIAELCQREVVSVDANASLQEAARLMRQQHVGAVAVTRGDGEGRQVVGLVTDRDLAIEVIAPGVDPSSIRAGDLPHGPVVAVPGSASLRDCAESMRQGGVRRVLVVGADGGVIGLVSADDVLSAISLELEGVSLALRSGIVREATERGNLPIQPRLRVTPPERGNPQLR